MHDDPFPAAEKILTDIEAIFKRDPKLNDFEILPVTVSENKSPVLHAEHTLGLEKWCVRHLYLHAYHKLMNLKQQQRLRREDPSTVYRLLLGAVLLNPDCAVLWNMRRELVSIDRLEPSKELHVSAVTLARRPKTSEAFVYRRWILERMLTRGDLLRPPILSQLLTEELRVTQMAADRYANNYHAWNHRMWVITHLVPHVQNSTEILSSEWLMSETWVARHVSEHSGLQYRQTVFNQLVEKGVHQELYPKLCQVLRDFFSPMKPTENCDKYCGKERGTVGRTLHRFIMELLESGDQCADCAPRCQQVQHAVHTGLLAQEMCLLSELIRLYPGHEALWSHRRFVLFSWCSLVKDISTNSFQMPEVLDGVPVPKALKMSNDESNFEEGFLWKMVLWHENNLFQDCTVGVAEDCYQMKLAQQHHKWFNQILLPRSRVNTDCLSMGSSASLS